MEIYSGVSFGTEERVRGSFVDRTEKDHTTLCCLEFVMDF